MRQKTEHPESPSERLVKNIRRAMRKRHSSEEKIRIESHLPVRRTLAKLGIQPARFYRWHDRLQTGGPEALEDKSPRPKRVWNRIPEGIRERIVQLALDEPELSPRLHEYRNAQPMSQLGHSRPAPLTARASRCPLYTQ